MSTSDHEDDRTPDLEELDQENDDEHVKLSHILQRISECKLTLRCWVIKWRLILFSVFCTERTWCTKIT